jgi:hypothetical protein
MRLLPATLLAAALAACSSPCQDLGNRLCQCSASGTPRSTCETQVGDELKRLNPSKAQEDLCSELLKTCHEPAGSQFCEWILTSDAKVACGIAVPGTDPTSSTAP